ncbi:glycosyltransferase family 39 protein [Solirubrum puertoriconensis]|uniref:Glycosyltransferase RgtA/B/C/D-like domain-containing protein n=1 Tax=Solirubrum puertoriconensis TaxID=1751427 RepID=A0A9X0HHP2_SOLP1|nr:glycosyltransferase family 39 protein [Solirubrum puertoriconensis]KUG06043.1 hypothetical protein ASU33_01350 [Solirubrum puertoriconensis]
MFDLSSDSVRRWVVPLFFGALLALGAALHQDYGIGWDESTERINGIINAKYVAQHLGLGQLAQQEPNYHLVPELAASPDADHGVAYQLLLLALERLCGAHDQRAIYLLRHFVNFLFFVAGAAALYALARRRFSDWRAGLLAAALLVLTPRFFAEAFVNYKDVVFASVFILGVFTLWRMLQRPNIWWVLLHAAASAFAIDVRTMGVLLPALTVGFGLLETWQEPTRRRALLLAVAAYLPLMAAFTVAGWPYLWEAPFANFLLAFRSFSRYRSTLHNFYLGELISARHLPWHYASVWIVVTTPLPFIALALLGLGRTITDTWRSMRQWAVPVATRFDLLVAAWLFGPLLSVIVFRSVIYDGWRHLYFVYPALVLLMAAGFRTLLQALTRWAPRQRATLASLLTAGLLLPPLAYLVRAHPQQQLYFSIPNTFAAGLFERDYWGVSYRQGLEWLLRRYPSGPLRVSGPHFMPLYNARLLLRPAERERVVLSSPAQAKYLLTTERLSPPSLPLPPATPLHQITADGIIALRVLQVQYPMP